MADLNVPNKKVGDKLKATEVNDIVNAIRSSCTQRRMPTEEYFKLQSYDENCFYILTDSNGLVDYMYLGTMLFAKRDTGGGSVGFPYSFPIVF